MCELTGVCQLEEEGRARQLKGKRCGAADSIRDTGSVSHRVQYDKKKSKNGLDGKEAEESG